MSGRQLNRCVPTTEMNRREFISIVGAAAAGASLTVLSTACGAGTAAMAPSRSETGSVQGSVVDLDGSARSVGRIFLLDQAGLNRGVHADVDSAGKFDFGPVETGEHQLLYWGANLAHVPEPLPNPVPITVRTSPATVVRFQVAAADEDETSDRDINAGDFFFQEQPSGEPNGTVVVKLGTLVCWYNVGTMPHTVSGGPWGQSAPLAHGDNFMWRASEVGTFAYRCDFHGARMLATLIVEP